MWTDFDGTFHFLLLFPLDKIFTFININISTRTKSRMQFNQLLKVYILTQWRGAKVASASGYTPRTSISDRVGNTSSVFQGRIVNLWCPGLKLHRVLPKFSTNSHVKKNIYLMIYVLLLYILYCIKNINFTLI